MSSIYVKWAPLASSSKKLVYGTRAVNQVIESVNSVKLTLKISDEVAQSITTKLNRDLQNIVGIKDSLASYASAIDRIAALYKKTENSLD